MSEAGPDAKDARDGEAEEATEAVNDDAGLWPVGHLALALIVAGLLQVTALG